jgi:hypothetical protein
MSQSSIDKITRIMLNEANSGTLKKPVFKDRLDPANFSRKVENIPGFIEKIENSKTRSSNSSSSGRPAQLYRKGRAKRLDPPLRLRVKQN